MKTKPLLSISLTAYNCEKYLPRAIESVISQPMFDRIEVILVDDGSVDKTGEICDIYSLRYENIKAVHKKNGGVSSAKNAGLDAATGKYLAFLDCDDWWEPNFFDGDICKRMEVEEDEDTIFSFATRYVDYTMKWAIILPVEECLKTGSQHGEIECDWRGHCTHIYSLKLLRKNNLRFSEDISMVEDMAFIEMTQWCSLRRIYINKILYNYWLNRDSVVHTGSMVKIFEQDYNHAKVMNEFFSKYGIIRQHHPVKRLGPALSELCSMYNYKDCQTYIKSHPLCEEQMKNIKSYHFRKAVEKPIVRWNKYGRLYWFYARIMHRTNRRLRKLIYDVKPLLAVVSMVKYKYFQGYSKFVKEDCLPKF